MNKLPRQALPTDIGILLLSVLLVCLPHFLHLPVWISIFCLSLLGWRFLYETRRTPLPGKYLRLFILLVAIVGLLFNYTTLLGRTAGSAMLLLMLCLKLMEIKGRRDVVIITYISFFILITSFLFDQSIYSGAYMLLVVLSLISSMIIYNHPAAQKKPLPQALRQTVRLALILLLQAIPLMLMLFFLFPRLPGPLWSMPDDSQTSRTGLSDELEAGRISRLVDNPAVAFRVRFAGRVPKQNQLYWRGPVLSLFDGRKWKLLKEDSVPRLSLDDIHFSAPVDYTITLEPHHRHWLFALDMPGSIPDNAYLTQDMQLLQNYPVNSVTRYNMRAYLGYQLDANSIINRRYYLQVPQHVAPLTRLFVNKLRKEHIRNGSFIKAVLNYFRQQNFIYTRQPPKLDGDSVDTFLFKSRRGYCVHYASSFAVIMRLAGIPARIVSGYQGGEMNPFSDYMIVRQSDAHAWVELWLAGKGWLRIDPTSVIPDSRIETTKDRLDHKDADPKTGLSSNQSWFSKRLRIMAFAWDSLNNHWNDWVIGYNDKRQKSLLARLGANKLSLYQLALLLAVAFMISLLFVTLFVFRHQQDSLNPVNRTYARFCRKLAACGFPHQAEESAQDYALRIIRQRPDLQSSVDTISRLYNHLRYAKAPSARLFLQFKKKVKHFHPQPKKVPRQK
ncbi:FIG001454: Transglutaminase-like enzymes, putative cysteine proteases [hydrothermal vent metagenome]|uniref:FIG001454: Transglutaminase-like enzymes, putative cysteine proteases n=1 Tax=hydrothermal vent metagenome TaxID=652676 RepID=A0A3B1C8T8_9ZZZZ